nr:uncharacterized protein LOC109782701 [Aegilops tauschii subsp. strangulata]
MPVQEGDRDDGSGEPMPVQEGDHDDDSGDRTDSGQPSGSSTTSVTRRGPKKTLRSDETFEIIAITRDGKPIEPIRTRDAFRAQCGVLVRDKIPISIHQWLKSKKEDPKVSYVSDMQKEDLWTTLKANFTLPPEEDPEKPVKEQLIKSHALKKMAELFRRWKNELKSEFVDKEKTPEFKGKYEKIRDHWSAFVAHKISEKSKKMSATNKKNAAKKKHHHRTGSGGYLKARPLWDKAENDLIAKGIEPETLNWPDRCRTWFFGVGGTLDPVTGKCVWTDEQMRIPVTKLHHYIKAAQQGTFVPDREKDELTMALGNPEHPGRTRGTPGSVPWKAGFPDAGGYKSQERRKKLEHSQLQALHARVLGLEEREADRTKRPAEASPEATPPSQRRSSVASTEQLQLEPVFTAPASYPVDAITESQHCHLMAQWMNLKVKAAVGSVLPNEPGATYHCRSIPEGYTRVMVDEITDGFEDLQLDHPTEKLPYERSLEENTKIMQAEVKNFFEGQKHPLPQEKIDPVKVKHTLAALRKPPKSPPKGNYERILEKSFVQAERLGSTVSSDIVANVPGRMVSGYNNLGDYLPDDVHYDFLEVDEHRYVYGEPLVKDERSLTTMMRIFHDWYMKTCRESEGRNILTLRVREEHDLVGIELLNVPFEEFFAFFNLKALDKLMVTCYCLLKIAELKKKQVGDIGFINTNLIDKYMVESHAKDTEAKLLQSFVPLYSPRD